MAKLETIQGLGHHQTITRDEIMERLHDRALAIVNVTPADSFKAGHIPGSLNLPIADIQTKAFRHLSNVHQEIAIYCAGPT